MGVTDYLLSGDDLASGNAPHDGDPFRLLETAPPKKKLTAVAPENKEPTGREIFQSLEHALRFSELLNILKMRV